MGQRDGAHQVTRTKWVQAEKGLAPRLSCAIGSRRNRRRQKAFYLRQCPRSPQQPGLLEDGRADQFLVRSLRLDHFAKQYWEVEALLEAEGLALPGQQHLLLYLDIQAGSSYKPKKSQHRTERSL